MEEEAIKLDEEQLRLEEQKLEIEALKEEIEEAKTQTKKPYESVSVMFFNLTNVNIFHSVSFEHVFNNSKKWKNDSKT